MFRTFLLILVFTFINSAASFGKDASDQRLNTYEKFCNTGTRNFFGFPNDGYSVNQQYFCELSFTFSPETYADRYNEILFIRFINGYGDAVNFETTALKKLKKETLFSILSADDEAVTKRQKIIKLATNGNRAAFFYLIKTANEFAEKGLKLSSFEESKLATIVPRRLASLYSTGLGGEKNKYANWIESEQLLDEFIETLPSMSHEHSKIILPIIFQTALGPSQETEQQGSALAIPDRLVSKFLILFTFSKHLKDSVPLFYELILARNLSAIDQKNFSMWQDPDGTFETSIDENLVQYFLLRMIDLNDQIHGNMSLFGPSYETLESIKFIDKLLGEKPIEQYGSYFPHLLESKILSEEPSVLEDDLLNIFQNTKAAKETDLLTNLAISDLSFALAYPKFVEEEAYGRLLATNPEIIELLNQPDSKLFKLNAFTNSDTKITRFEQLSETVFSSLTKSDFDCGDLPYLQCKKLKTGADIDDILEKHRGSTGVSPIAWVIFKLANQYPEIQEIVKEGDRSCLFNDQLRFYHKNLREYGYRPNYLHHACNLWDLSDLYNTKLEEFDNLLVKGLIYPKSKYASGQMDFTHGGNGLLIDNLVRSGISPESFDVPDYHLFQMLWEPLSYSLTTFHATLPTTVPDEPVYARTSGLENLASAYKTRGEVERSFDLYLKDFNLDLDERKLEDPYYYDLQVDSKVDLKIALRDMQIPEELIEDFLLEIWNHTNHKHFKDYYATRDGKVRSNFLEPKKDTIQEISAMDHDKFLDGFSSVIGLPSNAQQNFCEVFYKPIDKELYRQTNAIKNDIFGALMTKDHQELVNEIIGNNPGIGLAVLNFSFNCLNKLIEKSKKLPNKKMYNALLERINNVEQDNGDDLVNTLDHRVLPSLVAKSVIGRESNSIRVVAEVLINTTQIFRDLTRAFVTRNSLSLRRSQSHIEKILSNSLQVLKNYEANVGSDTAALSYLRGLHQALQQSVKHVVTSDATRRRLMPVQESDAATNSDYRNLKKLNSDIGLTLAKATNPIEYLQAKSAYGKIDLKPQLDPFSAHETVVSLSATGKPLKNHISLNSSANFISITEYTANGPKDFLVEIDGLAVEEIKKSIIRTGATNHTIERFACDVFKPVHDAFSLDPNRLFTITPSVNLFPIPLEIVLGNYCKGERSLYILTSSLLAAIELRYSIDTSVPEYFVGLGNPVIKNSGFDLSMLNHQNSETATLRSVDRELNDLAPLPLASEEIIEIASYFDESQTFTDENGSIVSTLSSASVLADQGKKVLIAFATHGLASDVSKKRFFPSMLTNEDNQLKSFTAPEILGANLNGSVVLLSACDTAAGLIEDPTDLFTGLVQSFADAGANLITASLWPVRSNASKNMSVNFVKSWKSRGLFAAIVDVKSSFSRSQEGLPFVFLVP